MFIVSSPRKECSWDVEKGVHNDSIHYRDKLYQFRSLVSKESSSTASPMSLISSAALHCHPSSGLIRAWAQFTSVSSASKRGELRKEHSYRAAFKASTGGPTPLCPMGFAVPKRPATFHLQDENSMNGDTPMPKTGPRKYTRTKACAAF